MKHSGFDRSGTTGRVSRSFTLIELLVVVGLMLLIMTFAVPAFQRLATGKSVDVSCRMLTGQLKLARAAAISEQKYLALVMPGDAFNAPDSEGANQYNFRSFRVAEVKPTKNASKFEFVKWYPGTEWAFLPVGAVIAEVNDSYLEKNGTEKCEVEGNDVEREVNPKWKKFDKSDTVTLKDKDSDDTVCKIVDGSEKMVDRKQPGREVSGDTGRSNTGSHWARAVVFDPKGRCCTGKDSTGHRYITVIEANLSAEDQQTVSEVDLLGMRIIKVHELTGRAEYVDTVRVKD